MSAKQKLRATQRRSLSARVVNYVRKSERVDEGAASVEVDNSNAQYQQLYQAAPIGFVTLDRKGRILQLNDRTAKLLGFPASWLVGKSFVVFTAREHTQRFLKFLRTSVGAEPNLSIELDLYVENITVPVQISLTSQGQGASLMHRLTIIDLTDTRQTEKLLEQSLANWYSLVQNAPEIIMTVEPRGRIEFVNRPSWGYSTSALIGTNLLDHVQEQDHGRVLRCLDQSFRFNTRSTCELTGICGLWDRWFSFSFGSAHTSNVAAVGRLKTTTTLMIREISEQKSMEHNLRTSGEQLRDFAARLDSVREEERTRVAREIHDELGQALTVLKMDLSWLETRTRSAPDARKRIKGMIEHVDDTIEKVRRISSELRPSILDDLGLIAAIEWQVAQFRKRTGVRTDLVSNVESVSLPPETSVALFRVVQEAITNIMRHAQASRVSITIDLMHQALEITIIDNGVGMKLPTEAELKSLGIVGMKERISRLGGDFDLTSQPHRGTRINIVVPVDTPK